MIKFKCKNSNDKIPNGIWMASTGPIVWLVIGDDAYPIEKGVVNKRKISRNYGWQNTYWIKISIKSYYENCS